MTQKLYFYSCSETDTYPQVFETTKLAIIEKDRFCDFSPASTQVAHRMQFSAVCKLLNAGDTLLVPRLNCLGGTLLEALHSIWFLKKKNARLICAELGPDDLLSTGAEDTIGTLACAAFFLEP